MKYLLPLLLLASGLRAQLVHNWTKIGSAYTYGLPAPNYLPEKTKCNNLGDVFVCANFSGLVSADSSRDGNAVLSNSSSTAVSNIISLGVFKYDAAGNPLFTKQIIGTGNVLGYSYNIDSNNDLVIVGTYTGEVDFDMSDAQFLMNAAGSVFSFFAKYNSNGDLIFAKSINGSVLEEVAFDSNNNICLIGNFSGTVDFDPGAGVTSLSCTNADGVILKYDPSGNLLFAKQLASGGTVQDLTYIGVDASDNIFIGGYISGTEVDFDPGAGVANVFTTGFANNIIYCFAKYDSNGNYQYVKSFGSTSTSLSFSLNDMEIDGSGNIVFVGMISGTGSMDVDPNAGTVSVSPVSYDPILLKYSNAGNYTFYKKISVGNFQDLCIDINDNYNIVGDFNATGDFDPGAGTSNQSQSGLRNQFLLRLNSSGIFSFFSQSPISTGNALTYPCIANDLSGNLFTADFSSGYSFSSSFQKYSDAGTNIFCKSILVSESGSGSSTPADDSGISIARDNLGNKYVLGKNQNSLYFKSSDTLLTSPAKGIFFAKYDSSGNCLFVKNLSNSTLVPYKIAIDNNNNIFITGYFTSSSVDFDPGPGVSTITASAHEGFLAKYNSTGDFIFVNQFTYIDFKSICIDNSNNVFLSGYFSSSADFDPSTGSNILVPGSGNGFFAKYNNSGNLLLVKQIPATVNAIKVDGSNNIWIGGTFSGNQDFDPGSGTAYLNSGGYGYGFFAKYSSTGAYVFAKQIGGIGVTNLYNLVLDNSNNAYVVGFFGTTGTGTYTIDFDPSGSTYNLTSRGYEDGYLAKYSSSGNLVFASQIGGAGHDIALDLSLDPSNNANVIGTFTGTCDFDPSAANLYLISAGNTDGFVSRYNSFGDLIFVKQIGSTGYDEINALTTDNNGTLTYIGGFSSTVDFDVDPVNQTTYSASTGGTNSEKDFFISQYKQSFFTLTTTIINGNVTCFNDANGAAAVTPNGNQPPYTYLWSPTGDTDSLVTTLPIGTHTVTVTDGFGLTMSTTVTIGGPSQALAISAGSPSPVTCYGGSNGFASVTVTGGGTPYSYNWQPSGNTGSSASNLSAGTQTVTVTDNYGCKDSTTITITEPPQLNISVVSQLNVSCNGGSNGIATVSATGGSGGNTFSWSPGGYSTTTVTNLSAGIYTVTVFDVNGCLAQTNVNITQPPALTATISSLVPVTCFNASNGSAAVTVGGGTSPYSYDWQPSGGATNSATNLAAGIYTVTVTDNKGCTANTTADIQYNAQTQEICVVTSDSATATFNIVVWEKPTDLSLIDSFYIYREITTNNYQKLGAVEAHALSEFEDHTADPNSTSYKYYITVLDSCGGESAAGLYHKSIHLQYSGLGNFNWTYYEIENTSNQVSSYNFYRDDNSTGNFVLLNVISGTNNTYTDVNYASYPNASYRVDVNWLSGHICTPTAKYGSGNNSVLGAINTSRSNVKSPSSIGLIDKNIETQYTIGPNPFINELNIQFSGERKTGVKLYNGLGQCVFEQAITTSSNLHLPELASGCYIIELNTPQGEIRKKLIK